MLFLTDLSYAFIWWFYCLLAGFAFLPAALKLFRNFFDRGYLFSKTLGISIPAYVLWLFSSLSILPFTKTMIFVVFVLLALSVYVLMDGTRTLRQLAASGVNMRIFVLEEALFLAGFLFWAYLRGLRPEINGLEKFMDFGFINSILHTRYMPPADIWFSGMHINYYYFGHYISAFLTKLSGIEPSIAYNLMMAALFSLTFGLAFSLSANVLMMKFNKLSISVKGGLLSAALVSLGGNLHTFIYAWLLPAASKLGLYAGDIQKYWFPSATRYIGHNPPTNDKTIHEFPFYSFVVSDLHAHVIDIILVLTVLAILFGYLTRMNGAPRPSEAIGQKTVFSAEIILTAFLVGLFRMTNYWDYPIYMTVSLCVFIYINFSRYGFRLDAFLYTVFQGAFVLVASDLISLPFSLKFARMAGDICLTEARSPLYQLLVLWGYQLLFAVIFVSFILIQKKNKSFKEYFGSLPRSDTFVLIVSLCALGLLIIPEIIYVKDIYSDAHKRANTMFKLTYQAFIMFGLSTGYIFFRVTKEASRRVVRYLLRGVLAVVIALPLIYPFYALDSWYRPLNAAGYKGLDGMKFLSEKNQGDYAAVCWLRSNVSGQPVILEANGFSYTDYERISMATGFPTVLGWYTHEHLWRGSKNEVNTRSSEIASIYQSKDMDLTRDLLKKYNISYIIIGRLEKEKYKQINEPKLLKLGKVVYESSGTKIIKVR